MRKGADKLIIQEIFKVVYSPLKAFEEIAKAPDFKGVILLFLITLLASVSAQYVSSSKTLLQAEEGSGTYVPLTATDLFSGRLMLTLTNTSFRFFLNWLIYGATFLLVLKLFRAKEGSWHKLFILIGYTFIVAAVFVFVSAIFISTFPTINFEFETWTKAFLEGDVQAQTLMLQKYENNWVLLPAYQIGSYLFIAVEVWTAALGAVAVHSLREVSWNKALIISTVVAALSFFLRFPLIF